MTWRGDEEKNVHGSVGREDATECIGSARRQVELHGKVRYSSRDT